MTTLTEWASKQALGPWLPRPEEALVHSPEQAADMARRLGGPVVAKASGVAHKSEQNLVRTGLDPPAAAGCFAELAAAGDGSVLVAEEVAGWIELIAGGYRDPQFGAVLMVGFGGLLAELLDEVAFVLSPPEPGELDRALRGLRGAALLDGYRGTSGVDRQALEAIAGAIADLLARDPAVTEVDCNPIVVDGDGQPIVLDALVVRDDGEHRSGASR